MDVLDTRIVAARRIGETHLAALQGSALEKRYCAWHGGSGRRYVMSVYPVERGAPDAGVPGFEGFILVPVAYRTGQRVVLGVTGIEREGDRQLAVAEAIARGAHEWHVHLLAAERSDRRAAVADLLTRHGATPEAAVA